MERKIVVYIAGKYSFNNGEEIIATRFSSRLKEIEDIIASVDASKCKKKESEEKTMEGKMLFSPSMLNRKFTKLFTNKKFNWEHNVRIECEYPTNFYTPGHQQKELNKGAFREMDFIKEKLGVEVQFGKYAFMVYNVCAKMTIFHKKGFIEAGVEIVPLKELADEMSTGVSYFEQFVWDLENRGVSNIDIPVLVFGVCP